MRVLILVGLLATSLAQPPLTTQAPKGFFASLGDIIKETAGAFAGSFTDYIASAGNNLVTHVVPNTVGSLVTSGIWSLLGTAVNMTRRDVEAAVNVEQLIQQEFRQFVEEAERKADGLKIAIQGLVNNLLSGRITPAQYLSKLPELTVNAQDILEKLREGVMAKVNELLGNKTASADLNKLITFLDNVERYGLAVIDQVRRELSALADPTKLLELIGRLGNQAGH